MNKEKIEKIMNEIDNIWNRYGDDDFNLAVYIYGKYGLYDFKKYINENELIDINKILKRQSSIFNEDICDEIETIND